MFTEDIMADPGVAPQIFDDPRTPKLRIYARGKGPGNPDIVTERTEAYVPTGKTRILTIRSTRIEPVSEESVSVL